MSDIATSPLTGTPSRVSYLDEARVITPAIAVATHGDSEAQHQDRKEEDVARQTERGAS
jgi:hypothetical protein